MNPVYSNSFCQHFKEHFAMKTRMDLLDFLRKMGIEHGNDKN